MVKYEATPSDNSFFHRTSESEKVSKDHLIVLRSLSSTDLQAYRLKVAVVLVDSYTCYST